MRRLAFAFLLLFSMTTIAQNLSLSQALALLNEKQEDWAITFVTDELLGLEAVTTLETLTEQNVPDAVEQLTKGLPVKVKVKKALRQIYVQRKQDKEMMSIHGKVLDNITRNDLPGAVVTLMTRDSTIIGTREAKSFWMNMDHSGYTSDFYFEVPHRQEAYILRATFEGHDTTYVDYNLSNVGKREFLRELPPVLMHKTVQHSMRELTVTASKVMFYYRGDTVVYNADAFQLAEGSMLDALVKQLPGVELKDGGEITVNGKHVEALLLNGKDFFRGDNRVMLENLPAYTVKQVEVYDKYGDKSEFLGQQLENDKRYVMDVKLKREYSIGWLVNAEAGGGPTPNPSREGGEWLRTANERSEALPLTGERGEGLRWLARLFAMRFSDHSRLAAYFNANNLNDGEQPGENGGYRMGVSPGQQTRQQGGVDYFTEDRDKKWKFEGNVRAEHTTNEVTTVTERVNYLPGGDTREHSRSVAEDKSLSVSTWNQFQYNFPKVQLRIKPSFDYQRWDNRSSFLSQAWNANDSLINTNLQQGSCKGYSLHPNLSTFTAVKLEGSSDYFEFETDACYDVKADDRFNRQRIESPSPYLSREGGEQAGAQLSSNNPEVSPPSREGSGVGLDQYFRNHPDRYGKLWLQGMYHWTIRRGLSLETALSYEYRNTQRESSLFLLDRMYREDTLDVGVLPSVAEYEQTMDMGNSYNYRLTEHYYSLRPFLWWFPKMKNGSWSISQRLPMRLLNRTLHYQRGQVDTVITHRTILFDTDYSYAEGRWNNGNALFIAYRLKADAPSMLNYVNIRDATDPLNITEGNSDLRNIYRHSLQVHHQKNYKDKQIQLTGGIDFVLTQNATVMSQLYDPETGVRTYKPYSINGNWEIIGAYGFGNLPLDKRGRLRIYVVPSVGYRHSVDLTGTTQLQRSTVSTTSLTPLLVARYSLGDLGNLKLDCEPKWQWLHSPRTDFTDFHVADYKTTLSVLLNLPWKLQLSTDLIFTARRGYSEESMNTNDWMWKARLARPFFKGNLVVMLDGFDILGQLRSTTNVLNAQGRIETYKNVPPRYVLLHAIWRFNRQPMRKSERKRAREEASKQ